MAALLEAGLPGSLEAGLPGSLEADLPGSLAALLGAELVDRTDQEGDRTDQEGDRTDQEGDHRVAREAALVVPAHSPEMASRTLCKRDSLAHSRFHTAGIESLQDDSPTPQQVRSHFFER
ncbi:MAG: hypothetical protein RJA70_3727 [Pseudomonadota bacterium]